MVTDTPLKDTLLERIGQDFDGECHLTEAEARAIHARIEALEREVERLTGALVDIAELQAVGKNAAHLGDIARASLSNIEEDAK